MYLSNIKLWNYRKYGNSDIFDLESPSLSLNLKNGINVLIGENDSGKTAIIDAIKAVLKTHSYEWARISEDDFFMDCDRFRIELLFEDLSDDEAKNFTEWLGWSDDGAGLQPFLRLIYDVSRKNGKIIPSDVRAGVDMVGQQMTAEAKEYLKSTYLKPLRDAKNELVPKKNSRLSQIFKEHEAFKNKDDSHHLIEIFNHFNVAISEYFDGKDGNGNQLTTDEKGKILKDEIDKYLQAFYDKTKKTEINVAKARLKNILEKLELLIEGEVNIGLGTLNRLFMASELLHLNKSEWSGIRLGLIEELEAHLHPQAQMQVIETLEKEENIQLILTTHSPNLASKVKLENIIICSESSAFSLEKKDTELEDDNYKFLERFLDTTKANLFFARGVIMVEGSSEELIIPILAKKMKSLGLISCDITEAGISIVNVGGTAFLNYSKIFLRKKEPFINIPISIITDVDIRAYKKNSDDSYEKIDETDTKTKSVAGYSAIQTKYEFQNIKAFIASDWTLEYALLHSKSLGNIFKEVLKEVHTRTSWDTDFEKELAIKLINKGLYKTEIAYRLAEKIQEDLESETPSITKFDDKDSIKYLIDAITYVCNK